MFNKFHHFMFSADNGALGWDDTINDDAPEFLTLAPGVYPFEVVDLERSYYDGSQKLPPCPMAIVKVKICTEEGSATITNRLFLAAKTQGLLSAFFTSIGDKKKGEPLKMDWRKVVGKHGYCRISNGEYNGQIFNKIKAFLPPEEGTPQPSQAIEQPGEPFPQWGAGKY